jgi:hypothetical protein
LAKLRDHLLTEGIVVAISRETLRRILRPPTRGRARGLRG